MPSRSQCSPRRSARRRSEPGRTTAAQEPRGILTHLLALAQTLLVAQVGIGLLLLSSHHRAADHLHYLYGTLSLLAVLAPWMYAPAERRGRLAWFTGATLVAGALAVRAYMTAT